MYFDLPFYDICPFSGQKKIPSDRFVEKPGAEWKNKLSGHERGGGGGGVFETKTQPPPPAKKSVAAQPVVRGECDVNNLSCEGSDT